MNSGLAAVIVVVSFVVVFFFFFLLLANCQRKDIRKQFLINTHCPRDRAENNFGRSVPVNIGAL